MHGCDYSGCVVTRRSSQDGPAPDGGSGWAEYVQAHLDGLGWSNATLAAASKLDRSLIGRWLNEGKQPSIESIRAVARVFKRDIREALVAAGYFTEDEMKVSAPQPPDLHLLDDDELLAEVKRRMDRRGPAGPRFHEVDGETTAADVAEISEQDGVESGQVEEVQDRRKVSRRARASG